MLPSSPKTRIILQFSAIVLLVLIVPAALTYINYQFSVNNPGGNDFLARWNGAHEWLKHGKNPYSDEVSLIAQNLIYGHPADVLKGEDIAHFVYPLYSMIFFAPFGMMEYTFARAVWMTLLEICMVLICLISLKMTGWRVKRFPLIGILLFCLLWYCAIRTIILGQYSGVNAVLILLSILAIQKKQDILAGSLLILSTSKPQMSYLLVLYVLFWAISVKRWRIVLSMAGSFIILMGITLILLPGWPIDWLRQLLNYPEYTNRIGSTLSIISTWVPGIQKPLNLFLHGAFYLYLLVEWIRSGGKDIRRFTWTAYLTLVITNLVAYRTATPHYVVLIAPIFLISRIIADRWGKIGQVILIGLYLLLFFGVWGLFLQTLTGVDENALVYLPVPILTLLLLWWVRWWAIAPPATLLEEIKS